MCGFCRELSFSNLEFGQLCSLKRFEAKIVQKWTQKCEEIVKKFTKNIKFRLVLHCLGSESTLENSEHSSPGCASFAEVRYVRKIPVTKTSDSRFIPLQIYLVVLIP
ncbi:hypothetical protein L596_011963 [Steinernema carpocapsae]|uniref:Uncharacterized protein n=1 Tax=Steinernema carpocapsae TaxID=34508 RepID=A0A4U5NWB0_STECR|nr:hypothetical protein L596_011963 [Steinernema carpocapsae]